jgi:hypothetical protein
MDDDFEVRIGGGYCRGIGLAHSERNVCST